MGQIWVYDVYLLNVPAILRGGEQGHILCRILPALTQATSVSLLRHTDQLTSLDWTHWQSGKHGRQFLSYCIYSKREIIIRNV